MSKLRPERIDNLPLKFTPAGEGLEPTSSHTCRQQRLCLQFQQQSTSAQGPAERGARQCCVGGGAGGWQSRLGLQVLALGLLGQKGIHRVTCWTQISHLRGTFISLTSQLGPLAPQVLHPPAQGPLTELGPSRAQCAALGSGLVGKQQWWVVWEVVMLPSPPWCPLQSSAQK